MTQEAKILREGRAAYSGLSKWVGIVLGGASLFSWLAEEWPISLSDVISQLVAAYRAVFHAFAEFVFGWVPLSLPEWWKDAVVLYFATGGAVSRTLWSFYAQKKAMRTIGAGPPIVGTATKAHAQKFWIAFSVVLWPISLAAMFLAPFVYRDDYGRLYANQTYLGDQPDFPYICNLRWVFVLQLAAMVAVCAATMVINAFLSG